ncbi:MAG: hypothetical protein JWQ03_1834 [Variovorax sp.]|nr:hypothetical protein [Variovorax sp.]
MKKPLKVAAFFLSLTLFVEGGLRATAIGDFPLYEANSEIGYIPKKSQSGSFLWRNDWQFNSKSMGAPEFTPNRAVDTLLIGDSIVLGGNTYRQKERLGPQLSNALGHAVWPISAGSWALRNELTYLRTHPEVVRDVAGVTFVLNSGDFGAASSWACEETHPRTYPVVLSVYLLKKYVYDWSPCGEALPSMQVPPGDWKKELREFLASEPARGKSIRVILYPDKAEMENPQALRDELEVHSPELVAQGIDAAAIRSVGRDPRWKPAYYKDVIHPTVEGMRVLAKIIGETEAPLALQHY